MIWTMDNIISNRFYYIMCYLNHFYRESINEKMNQVHMAMDFRLVQTAMK